MSGKNIGYRRVSTFEQTTARQLTEEDVMAKYGIKLDRVFEDKCSAKDTDRPGLKACLEYIRDGDTLYVHEISRLARSMADLQRLVDQITDSEEKGGKEANIVFCKEGLAFTHEEKLKGKACSTSWLMFQIMGAFAEFERNLILERQREGIAKAKAAGKYRGGKEKLTDEQVAELCRRRALGVTISQLSRDFKISRQSVYRYLEKAE